MQNHDSDYQALPDAGSQRSSGSKKSKHDDYERVSAGGGSNNVQGGGRSNDSVKDNEAVSKGATKPMANE
jgi:hypothetical protein